MALTIDRPESFIRVMSGYYGNDWLDWTPEITEAVLKSNFAYDPDPLGLDKVEAVKSCLRNNLVFEDPALFENVVLLMNDEPIVAGVWKGCTAQQLAFGVSRIVKITGEENLADASPQVRAYAAAICVNDGIHVGYGKAYLDFCDDEIAKLSPGVSKQHAKSVEEVLNFATEAGIHEIDTRAKKALTTLSASWKGLPEDLDMVERIVIGTVGVLLYLGKRGVSLFKPS